MAINDILRRISKIVIPIPRTSDETAGGGTSETAMSERMPTGETVDDAALRQMRKRLVIPNPTAPLPPTTTREYVTNEQQMNPLASPKLAIPRPVIASADAPARDIPGNAVGMPFPSASSKADLSFDGEPPLRDVPGNAVGMPMPDGAVVAPPISLRDKKMLRRVANQNVPLNMKHQYQPNDPHYQYEQEIIDRGNTPVNNHRGFKQTLAATGIGALEGFAHGGLGGAIAGAGAGTVRGLVDPNTAANWLRNRANFKDYAQMARVDAQQNELLNQEQKRAQAAHTQSETDLNQARINAIGDPDSVQNTREKRLLRQQVFGQATQLLKAHPHPFDPQNPTDVAILDKLNQAGVLINVDDWGRGGKNSKAVQYVSDDGVTKHEGLLDLNSGSITPATVDGKVAVTGYVAPRDPKTGLTPAEQDASTDRKRGLRNRERAEFWREQHPPQGRQPKDNAGQSTRDIPLSIRSKHLSLEGRLDKILAKAGNDPNSKAYQDAAAAYNAEIQRFGKEYGKYYNVREGEGGQLELEPKSEGANVGAALGAPINSPPPAKLNRGARYVPPRPGTKKRLHELIGRGDMAIEGDKDNNSRDGGASPVSPSPQTHAISRSKARAGGKSDAEIEAYARQHGYSIVD